MPCKDTCAWGSPKFCSPGWSWVECPVCGDTDAIRTQPGVAWPDWSTAAEVPTVETMEMPDGQE